MGRYLRVNLLGPGPRLIKRIYRTAVYQRLRNTGLEEQTVEGKDPKWRSVVCEGETAPCRSEEGSLGIVEINSLFLGAIFRL